MDKKIKGSWLIHHTNKLQNINNQAGFEKTFLSGKSGILLSAISSNNQITITNKRLEILAKAANINTLFELPKLLEVLKKMELIDIASNGISVLGVTTTTALQHTANIFDSLEPNSQEQAAIDLAERASLTPVKSTDAASELADLYHLNKSDIDQVIYDSEQIGFIDVENIGKNDKLLFNGNLFRRETKKKSKQFLTLFLKLNN